MNLQATATWRCRMARAIAIMGLFEPNPRESPAIPKQRKPPSQRPERQLDETARAIARLQEEAKAEKSSESRKGESTGSAPKRQAPPAVNGMGQRKIGGASPYTSTKRPKTGGA